MTDRSTQSYGDGKDNYINALHHTADVINKSAAAAKAGINAGAQASTVAAGTAAGGVWGAAFAAAWSMRHTLYKLLICACLILLIIIILLVSLPSIVTNPVFGTNGFVIDPAHPLTLQDSYQDLSNQLQSQVTQAYENTLEQIEKEIIKNGYDYDLSMNATENLAVNSVDYDVSYILSAYSVSMKQRGTNASDMFSKLNLVSDKMFPVSMEEKEEERIIPAEYTVYQPATVTVVTSRRKTGTVNGVPQYTYTTKQELYYLPSGSETTSVPVSIPSYIPVSVSVPIYSGDIITGSNTATYYSLYGTESIVPRTEMVQYLKCTIHPFDESVILKAFELDPNEQYSDFEISNSDAIAFMADALKMTLYGTLGKGQAVPLTDSELLAFVNRQNCNETRKHILTTALSLVGKVPYFWGGKSDAGWNDKWNTLCIVTAPGVPETGTLLPYGMDCSGFTDWVFKTALGVSIKAGSWNQYDNSIAIKESELQPGDLGFLAVPGSVPINHVLIYAGTNESGEKMWVHCTGGIGVTLNSPDYVTQYRRPINVNYDAAYNES